MLPIVDLNFLFHTKHIMRNVTDFETFPLHEAICKVVIFENQMAYRFLIEIGSF